MPDYQNTRVFEMPRWYLAWCMENEELQTHWRTEWEDEEGKLHSNIHPGDRFSLGKTNNSGIVYEKTLLPCVEVGKKYTYSYRIGGAIAANSSNPIHKTLADGRYLWIPTIEQLLALSHYNQAMELFMYIGNRSDQRPLVEKFLEAADNAGKAGNTNEKREAVLQYLKYDAVMKKSGISIDEAENPEDAMEKEGTEAFNFFHVRIDGKPYKRIDARDGQWSDFQ